MADQAVSISTPLDVPLPPIASTQYFSDDQWKILFALADAIIPSIRTRAKAKSPNDKVVSDSEWDAAVSRLTAIIPGPDSAKIATQYLEEDASSNPAFRDGVERIFGEYVHNEGRNGFSLILNALKYVSLPGRCRTLT